MMSCAAASREATANADGNRPVKIFVRGIPRNYDEKDLRTLFRIYGDVLDLKMPKDPVTGFHKGCCVLTYTDSASAKRAVFHFHGRRCLQGMDVPMHIEVYGQENRQDPKRILFIGMLPKQCDEMQLEAMLFPYGEVEDCKVLRDPSGRSEACAYAKMCTRLQSVTAIQHLHDGPTMEGSSSRLIVRLAGSAKECEREARRLQGHQNPFPRKKEVLEGSNIVIYDLPAFMRDVDLLNIFHAFGKVIRVKVSSVVGGSRQWCGFVSYNDEASATLASIAMNGYQIGPNRLTVSVTDLDLDGFICKILWADFFPPSPAF